MRTAPLYRGKLQRQLLCQKAPSGCKIQDQTDRRRDLMEERRLLSQRKCAFQIHDRAAASKLNLSGHCIQSPFLPGFRILKQIQAYPADLPARRILRRKSLNLLPDGIQICAVSGEKGRQKQKKSIAVRCVQPLGGLIQLCEQPFCLTPSAVRLKDENRKQIRIDISSLCPPVGIQNRVRPACPVMKIHSARPVVKIQVQRLFAHETADPVKPSGFPVVGPVSPHLKLHRLVGGPDCHAPVVFPGMQKIRIDDQTGLAASAGKLLRRECLFFGAQKLCIR